MQSSNESQIADVMPARWVEQIWKEMRSQYGSPFDRQWQCPAGEDVADHVAGLKAHWGKALAGFCSKPHMIRYGLDNLPPHPPNLPEFRALCCRAPELVVPALPAPKADPARVAEVLAPLRQSRHKEVGSKDWAWAMRDREVNHGGELPTGRLMTQYHRDAWRIALKHGQFAEAGDVA